MEGVDTTRTRSLQSAGQSVAACTDHAAAEYTPYTTGHHAKSQVMPRAVVQGVLNWTQSRNKFCELHAHKHTFKPRLFTFTVRYGRASAVRAPPAPAATDALRPALHSDLYLTQQCQSTLSNLSTCQLAFTPPSRHPDELFRPSHRGRSTRTQPSYFGVRPSWHPGDERGTSTAGSHDRDWSPTAIQELTCGCRRFPLPLAWH